MTSGHPRRESAEPPPESKSQAPLRRGDPLRRGEHVAHMASRSALYMAGLFVTVLSLLLLGYAMLYASAFIPLAAIFLACGVAAVAMGLRRSKPRTL